MAIKKSDLEDVQNKLMKAEVKISMLQAELQQYLRDLQMWKTSQGAHYPERRMAEIRVKIEEIEKI